MRTVVTFKSDRFNTTEEKPYFINPECYGDDVARWLIGRVRANGGEAETEPGQEDFGWYFGFSVDRVAHTLVIGYQDDDPEGYWIGCIERNKGLISGMFGGRNRDIMHEAVLTIHRALTGTDMCHDVEWHHKADFDAGRNSKGSSDPAAD